MKTYISEALRILRFFIRLFPVADRIVHGKRKWLKRLLIK